MNIVIAGSRDFIDYPLLSKAVKRIINRFYKDETITIVSGCARGADKLGEMFAIKNNYDVIKKPAEWSVYGRKAGYIRNTEMAKIGDVLIAFWDMKSPGTRNMITLANKYNLQVFIIDIERKKIIQGYMI